MQLALQTKFLAVGAACAVVDLLFFGHSLSSWTITRVILLAAFALALVGDWRVSHRP